MTLPPDSKATSYGVSSRVSHSTSVKPSGVIRNTAPAVGPLGRPPDGCAGVADTVMSATATAVISVETVATGTGPAGAGGAGVSPPPAAPPVRPDSAVA